MSTLGTTSGEVPAAESPTRILVWDLPTRIFHWSLAASFAIAWLSAESERWRDVHLVAGYAFLALIAFRLVWGIAGTRYARFTEFIRGPAAICRYLRSLLSGRPEHHVGHNPAGGLAIVLLLGLGLLTGLSGWAAYNEVGGPWGEALEDLHEAFANGMLAVVLVHIVGVVVSSLAHRENLIRAMITGRKAGSAAEGIVRSRALVALSLAVALAGIWGFGLLDSPARLPGLDVAVGSPGVAGAGAPPRNGRGGHGGRERDERD